MQNNFKVTNYHKIFNKKIAPHDNERAINSVINTFKNDNKGIYVLEFLLYKKNPRWGEGGGGSPTDLQSICTYIYLMFNFSSDNN